MIKTRQRDLAGSFCMGFSLLRVLEFFADPKNGNTRNQNPPAMRVESKRYTKKSPFRYNRVVQALLQKGKVILWRIKIMI